KPSICTSGRSTTGCPTGCAPTSSSACSDTIWNGTCASAWRSCSTTMTTSKPPRRSAPASSPRRSARPPPSPSRPPAGPKTASPSTASRPCSPTSRHSQGTPSQPPSRRIFPSPSPRDQHPSRRRPSLSSASPVPSRTPSPPELLSPDQQHASQRRGKLRLEKGPPAFHSSGRLNFDCLGVGKDVVCCAPACPHSALLSVSRRTEIAHVEHDRVRRTSGPAEPMGPDRIRGDHGRTDRDRAELSRNFGAPACGEPAGHFARLFEPALLRAAHGFAHVRRALLLSCLHLYLCDSGGEEPALGDGADPGSRHSAIRADPGLSVLHRDVLSRSLPRQYGGRGIGGDLRDLHQPSLEHGLRFLSVAAHRAARPRGGCARVAPDRLAEVLAARGALRDAGAHLEHDDVDVGRLVLRRRFGGDHSRQHDHHPSRRRLLHRQGQ